MNWKELWIEAGIFKSNARRQIQFIETQIIEKLIEDIPDESCELYDRKIDIVGKEYIQLDGIKQQLKSKWQ